MNFARLKDAENSYSKYYLVKALYFKKYFFHCHTYDIKTPFLFCLLNGLAYCTLLDVSSVCTSFFDCEETHVFLWLDEPWVFLFLFYYYFFFLKFKLRQFLRFLPTSKFFQTFFSFKHKIHFPFCSYPLEQTSRNYLQFRLV